jgi:WD40 repeat protein
MKNVLLCLIIAIAATWTGFGQRKDSSLLRAYAYSPAFISTIRSPGHARLVIFPFYGKSLDVPIHSASGGFVISSDGEALYGSCASRSVDSGADDHPIIALCKIDLRARTVTPIPGSSGLRVFSLAVSSQGGRILFSGADPQRGGAFGLFELTQPAGKVRTILSQSDKRPQSQWMNLSFSSDNERAVGTHQGRVELIDIRSGSTKPLDGELFMASWSPNGRWLAAVEKGQGGHTILMDAKTLIRQRTLGPSELDWSPDSRYILAIEACGPYSGTFEAMSVETGERTAVEGSHCQVNQATTGWVPSDLTER